MKRSAAGPELRRGSAPEQLSGSCFTWNRRRSSAQEPWQASVCRETIGGRSGTQARLSARTAVEVLFHVEPPAEFRTGTVASLLFHVKRSAAGRNSGGAPHRNTGWVLFHVKPPAEFRIATVASLLFHVKRSAVRPELRRGSAPNTGWVLFHVEPLAEFRTATVASLLFHVKRSTVRPELGRGSAPNAGWGLFHVKRTAARFRTGTVASLLFHVKQATAGTRARLRTEHWLGLVSRETAGGVLTGILFHVKRTAARFRTGAVASLLFHVKPSRPEFSRGFAPEHRLGPVSRETSGGVPRRKYSWTWGPPRAMKVAGSSCGLDRRTREFATTATF